jgi:hypothetical protein
MPTQCPTCQLRERRRPQRQLPALMMRGTRRYGHPRPQILSSTRGWNCNLFSYIKKKRFTVTVVKTIKEKVNHSKLTFVTEGFRASVGQGNFLAHLRGVSQRGVSSLDADEPEPNKSNARVGARAAPLPPAEVEYVFLPSILMSTTIAFSAMLNPEDFATKFLLHFTGLARVSSTAKV